jgi:hypothetical protein
MNSNDKLFRIALKDVFKALKIDQPHHPAIFFDANRPTLFLNTSHFQHTFILPLQLVRGLP